ncbi:MULTISPECIES: bifunctional methionine sulfoxide reductase B/A protein [unclassified Lentimicrobium]|uniref:bifunctional methionine sulfoxide reductase B/A protein n=1 Tax=unclassified Lentimicrobium TaxID=2677434 RepID=UPI00155573DF|nr:MULTISPECIES: bifunctional methionine sulfoxide reductase B/A protein [unclassified Lentimicrobium]NPD44892.1 bifunctional methionine sulfoxide reductase B/A protein [Lentimicrobium sp. S6]NPD83718.1 bifunctional methionine sulfoxide reductase B/A protein [Lentimicrobium sp. L6]
MRTILFLTTIILFSMTSQGQNKDYNKLTIEEQRVILDKGTERPYTGEFYEHEEEGIYLCKQCDAPLYKSEDKFNAHCGWPSFDEEIEGAVKRTTDADGRRTEITCANCGGHLGHVFIGERYTNKNTRHCVNSVSLEFQAATLPKREVAYFASGCFWGTQYHFEKKKGVISSEVGYMGGDTKNPSYREVCSGTTGHAETTKVIFDPSKTSFEELAILFFETHDPSQVNRQGPDIGTQYRSAVYYTNNKQKEIIEKLSQILENKGIKVVTELEGADIFYAGEDYHQNYYNKKGGSPYCHIYQKKF